MFGLNLFLQKTHWAVVICGSLLTVIAAFANRKVNRTLLLLYMVFVVYMTMVNRQNGIERTMLELFWSYRLIEINPEIRMEILNNIWLFIPLGAILYRLYPKWRITLLPVCISISIEILQYMLKVGLSELDDIISNTIGGVVGVILCALVSRIRLSAD